MIRQKQKISEHEKKYHQIEDGSWSQYISYSAYYYDKIYCGGMDRTVTAENRCRNVMWNEFIKN